MFNNNQSLPVQVLKIVVALFIFVAVTSSTQSYAQNNPQSQPASNQQMVFVGVNFIKIKPGKQEQYTQLLEKYGKKINEYFYKKENLIGWYLYKILIPSGTSVDYDYASVNITPTITSLLDPAGSSASYFKKAFPEMTDKMISDVMAQYDDARQIVRREIFVPVSGAQTGDTSNPVPPKYLEVDLMHPAAGKFADYIKMEKETFMPLHVQRIKTGYLRNWGLYEKAFADEKSGYEFVTVNFFDNLDKLGGGYEEAIKKVSPNANMDAMMSQTMATRSMIRSEIWKLTYFVDKSNTKR